MNTGLAMFEQRGDEYHPTDYARRPWDGGGLSGAALAGLTAHISETAREHGTMQPARVSVDFFGHTQFAKLDGSCSEIRRGRTTAIESVTLSQEGNAVCHATVLWVASYDAASESGLNLTWTGRESLPRPRHHPGRPSAPWFMSEGYSDWSMNWGDHLNPGRKFMWHNIIPVVEAQTDKASLGCVALFADSASLVANWGDRGVEDMNLDLTVTVTRLPTSANMGLAANGRICSGDRSTGTAILYDDIGQFGFATVTAIKNNRGVLDVKNTGVHNERDVSNPI